VNAVDYSGYPDCRPEYIQAFETMANLATRSAVEGKGRFHIHTPLIDMTKARIIQAGTALGVDYGMTHSCYDPSPDGWPAAAAIHASCAKTGLRDAGVPDPTPYRARRDA
jgi:7-cyano-7-deazaguanine synthase